MYRTLVLATILILFAPHACAQATKRPSAQKDWAVGFTFRTSNIPFKTDEKAVATLIPLIMYDGDRFFFREIEGGFRVLRAESWQLSILGRTHFFDFPARYQNLIQGDTVDWGVQLRYRPTDYAFLDLEALSDTDGHSSAIVSLQTAIDKRRWNVSSGIDLRYRTSHYNSYFWGLTLEDVAAGVDVSLGSNAYFHVGSSFYLQGALQVTYLSAPVRRSSFVEDALHVEAFAGFALSNDKTTHPKTELNNTPYVRVAHGWATPSALMDVVFLNVDRDPGNHQLSTVFYGLPLTDTLFGLPVHIYLHSGFGMHWESPYQDHSQEIVLAIKLFYTMGLPVRIRLGFAEGVSWLNRIPAVEEDNLRKKGFEPSQLLNYLGPSLELSLGDLLPWKAFDDIWLGYYIHHRSAIFETAQQFGRIKGGSNYQMIALKYHY